MKEAEITTGEILEAVNRSFSVMQERFDGLQTELRSFKFETEIHFNNLESDLNSFKIETKDNFAIVNEKIDDLYDTTMGHGGLPA